MGAGPPRCGVGKLYKLGSFAESKVSPPNSVLLFGLIETGCTEGIILISLEVIVFTVIGTSKVDLATKGLC